MPPDIRANSVCVIHKTLENCRLKSEAVSCQVTARHRCERGVQTCFYLSGVLMDTSSTQQTVSLFQKKEDKNNAFMLEIVSVSRLHLSMCGSSCHVRTETKTL